MNIFEACDCQQRGVWEEGIKHRGRRAYACLNCNGDVPIELVEGKRIVSKSKRISVEPFCNCGIPWLSEETKKCGRCDRLIENVRFDRLMRDRNFDDLGNGVIKANPPVKIDLSIPVQNSDMEVTNGWARPTFGVLALLAIFGFCFNNLVEPVSDEFVVFVVETFALSYTNFLAYPLLLFALVGVSDSLKWLEKKLRNKVILIFFLSPLAVIALQTLIRMISRIW